jgi:hypothetical protein
MTINFTGVSDDRLPPMHTSIFGVTGSGKSTAMKNEPDLAGAKRQIYWDPDRSHQMPDEACRFKSPTKYWVAFKQAMASNKPFKLALTMPNTKENFQVWCMMLVRVACAKSPVTAFVEELHQCTGNAQAEGYWSDLLSRSRKYGVRLVVISPRPEQCDKTTVTSCNIKYVCKLGRFPDRKSMALELGISPRQIEQLGRLNVPNETVHWWYQGQEGEPIAVCHNFKDGTTKPIDLP